MAYYASYNTVTTADMSKEEGWVEISEEQYHSGVEALTLGLEVVIDNGFYIRDAAPSPDHEWDGEEWVLPPQPEPEPLTPEELRSQMGPLAKWRFESMVDLNGLREPIDQAIASMPEPQRTIAFNKRNHVPEFYRTDQLFEQLGPVLGKSPEDIDNMWQEALDL